MNNFDFVERFISGTKDKQLKWSEFSGSLNGCTYRQKNEYDQAFFIVRNGSIVLSTKKELFDQYDENVGYAYALIILAPDMTELYRIDADNLFDSDDGKSLSYVSEDSKLVLSRLFRLAERSAKHIDRLLENLAKGLTDPSGELPF